MSRSVRATLLLLAGLLTSACGATVPPSGSNQIIGMTPEPAVTAAPATNGVERGAISNPADASPVTPMMAELQLAGEPFGTQGDSNAPITVVEFSDYG